VQRSGVVHGLPSSQAVPSGRTGLEHAPVAGLQVPAEWQPSAAAHTTGFAPVQTPLWQLSERVQALPSLQAVPFDAVGFEQTPVAGLQVPATWQASLAEHTTGLAPTQAPLWQVSLRVQALPSLQAAPFAAAGFEQVPVVALQLPAT
jgi:hypothetical protein